MDENFGAFVRKKRLLLGLTLREFCKKFDYDVFEFNKIENGISCIENDDNLKRLAGNLEINENSFEMKKFIFLFKCFNKNSGVVEKTDEELIKMLPIFFREKSCQEEKNDEKEEQYLENLINLLRNKE